MFCSFHLKCSVLLHCMNAIKYHLLYGVFPDYLRHNLLFIYSVSEHFSQNILIVPLGHNSSHYIKLCFWHILLHLHAQSCVFFCALSLVSAPMPNPAHSMNSVFFKGTCSTVADIYCFSSHTFLFPEALPMTFWRNCQSQ